MIYSPKEYFSDVKKNINEIFDISQNKKPLAKFHFLRCTYSFERSLNDRKIFLLN